MFNQRNNPLYARLKEIVGSGAIGRIRRTNWIITTWWRPQGYYDQSPWRATWGGEGGGVLVNQAPHQLDLWQWICGTPRSVYAKVAYGFRRDIAVEDEVTALVDYGDGATGIFVTATHDMVGTDRFEILGDIGKIVVMNSKTATVTRLTKPERELSDSMSIEDVRRVLMGKVDPDAVLRHRCSRVRVGVGRAACRRPRKLRRQHPGRDTVDRTRLGRDQWCSTCQCDPPVQLDRPGSSVANSTKTTTSPNSISASAEKANFRSVDPSDIEPRQACKAPDRATRLVPTTTQGAPAMSNGAHGDAPRAEGPTTGVFADGSEGVTRGTTGQQPVLVIMGVSGSGKSTIAGILAGQLGWDLEEGDDLHPAANVAKMRAGEPLTDDDRWPWLDKVAAWISDHTTAGVPGIITCSALKRIYRDRMRGPNVVFVHLAGSKDQIGLRLAARSDHFMPPALLNSQVATLEPPGPDENTLIVDVGRKPAEVAAEIIRRLEAVPAHGSSGLGSAHPGQSSAPQRNA